MCERFSGSCGSVVHLSFLFLLEWPSVYVATDSKALSHTCPIYVRENFFMCEPMSNWLPVLCYVNFV